MADYQMEYRGLTMGLGTAYHINEVDGLEDDAVRIGDSPLPRRGGDIQGLHVPNSRHITLSVSVIGEKGSQALRDSMQALHDAFQHSDTAYPLYFDEPGITGRRYVLGRVVDRVSKRTPRQPFLPQYMLRLKLADPRTYAATPDQDTANTYSASGGGLDYGVTEYGKEYTADLSSELVMLNNGNANAYPLIRFYGPTVGTVTEVTLTNVTTGVTLVLGTTILTGQILTADMHAIATVTPTDLAVIRLGTTNKYGDWAQPRTPFYLAPGDNTMRFEVTGGTSTDAYCVIKFNDTWL